MLLLVSMLPNIQTNILQYAPTPSWHGRSLTDTHSREILNVAGTHPAGKLTHANSIVYKMLRYMMLKMVADGLMCDRSVDRNTRLMSD
jgi:hypothetical protein